MTTETTFDVERIMNGAHDAISARRVFGDPIERDGLIVIPAAMVRGGAGGGGGTAEAPVEHGVQHDGHRPQTGSGGGAGFGVAARPVGAFVVRGGDVEWRPAVDRQRVVMGVLVLLGVVVLALRPLVLRRR